MTASAIGKLEETLTNCSSLDWNALCRDSCFETTLVHLTERFNGKDVYLVGTANQSTMLAQRTQKLIEEVEPDTVIVQTSPKWWDNARSLRYVDSQDELN